jgi:hypothetical protein
MRRLLCGLGIGGPAISSEDRLVEMAGDVEQRLRALLVADGKSLPFELVAGEARRVEPATPQVVRSRATSAMRSC